jgi:RND superfamily putative drug exporter
VAATSDVAAVTPPRLSPSGAIAVVHAYGRVITAAAAFMICVVLSFMLGNERPLKQFGFGLAAAIFLDAVVVRCMLLPAVLELLGSLTWKLLDWLSSRLPNFNIEGSSARGPVPRRAEAYEDERELARLGS